MIGAGFIGRFYTEALHGYRSKDRVHLIYSYKQQSAQKLAEEFQIPHFTTDLQEAVHHPEIDAVVIALPNHLHEQVVLAAAQAGKAILCTKPLGRNAQEAFNMLQAVEKAGVFHGYLEDLVYTPKNLKAIAAVQSGAIGRVLWTRSRETHPGPHSDWFWDMERSGGGALIDMGCHCIEIGRNFIGKNVKPLEVMCWTATQVKPIDAEDHAIGLVKYANGAVSQFEVSWNFRGGMDLRDEVMGTEGTVWVNNFLRTGFEMFSAGGKDGYVAEKAESDTGWLFPVGDETIELGYLHMFTEMFRKMEDGAPPMETFYDGYVVNEIMDACYRSAKSKKWEPIELKDWRGEAQAAEANQFTEYDAQHWLVKQEKLPSGTTKIILKNKASGELIQREE